MANEVASEVGPETFREMVKRLIRSTEGMIPPQNHIDQVVGCYEEVERHASALAARVSRLEGREQLFRQLLTDKIELDRENMGKAYEEGEPEKHRFYRQEMSVFLGIRDYFDTFDDMMAKKQANAAK